MKHRLRNASLVAFFTIGAFTAGALAQSASPRANSNASTPAIATGQGNNPGAPAEGANSFTQRQAKSRIRAKGYSDISRLVKDKDGVWRGTATKDGTTVGVGLDYQGNVVQGGVVSR